MKDYDYLFVRPDAKLDGSKPISGGLPHCFPQFGPGVIQQHGFARNLEWDVVESSASSASLKLSNNDETMAMWPHPFECTYKVGVNCFLGITRNLRVLCQLEWINTIIRKYLP